MRNGASLTFLARFQFIMFKIANKEEKRRNAILIPTKKRQTIKIEEKKKIKQGKNQTHRMSGSLAAVSYPNMISKYLQFSLSDSTFELFLVVLLFEPDASPSRQKRHQIGGGRGHYNNKVAQKIVKKK